MRPRSVRLGRGETGAFEKAMSDELKGFSPEFRLRGDD